MDKEEMRKLAESLGFSGKEVIAFKVGAGFMMDLLSKDGKMLYCEQPQNNVFAEYWKDQKTSKSVLQGRLIDVKEIKCQK